MKRFSITGLILTATITILAFAGDGLAGIPEPDVIFYGKAENKGFEPTSEQIILVFRDSSEQLAAYTLGSNEDYGQNYVLKVAMDVFDPIEGKSVSFYIGGILAGETVIPPKGSVVELDLDTLYNKDNDNDGMDDSWETKYFGNLERDGTEDINGDLVSDLDEYRNGSDPTAAVWQDIDETHRETCVFHPLVLQKALTEAGEDGRHNLIKVQNGIYVGHFSYKAVSGENFDLEIVGGYGPDCVERDLDPDVTVLEGGGNGPVLALETGETGQNTGGICVQGFYIKNGAAPGEYGGGIRINTELGSAKIIANKIADNSAYKGGGMALATKTGQVFVANNVVFSNIANNGGGIWVTTGSGVVYILNNTIDANAASKGAGIYCRSDDSSLIIENNIVSNSVNGKGIWIQGEDEPNIDYNILWNNTAGNYNEAGLQGGHDLSEDPLFIDPSNNDFSLQAASPCIDIGNKAFAFLEFDHKGKPRVMDGDGDNIYQVDMGAYELGQDIPEGCNPLIDSDCDGVADSDDQCPGYDDSIDTDKDGVPDGCDKCPESHDFNDDDGDNMPNGWEVQYSLDPSKDDAHEDADRDSFTNLQEYLGGSNPKDPYSIPPSNGPVAPALNYPLDNSEVSTQTPMLSVSTSKNYTNQTLTYRFEVYLDAGLTTLVTSTSGVEQGEQAITAWIVDVTPEDNTFYYWRARSYDGINYSLWMNTAKFFVNTANDAPSIPNISRPADQSEVSSLQPVLEITNAQDIDHDPLIYEFEVFSDQEMTELITSKTDLLQGKTGTTSWQINMDLEDNISYWWRVQARDDENDPGGWSNLFGFKVNTSNNAPAAPSINSPQDGEDVDSLLPVLEIEKSTDPDSDVLSYVFEIDKVSTFDSPALEQSSQVAEAEGETTSWSPSELIDETRYYWRVRAYDEKAYSAWSTGSFFVNLVNDPPGMPTIHNPGQSSEVTTLRPVLSVNPCTDAELDQITYDYEVYSEENLFNLISSINGAKSSWQVNTDMIDNLNYYWRVRAVDEHGAASDWSSVVSFFVNTANDKPGAPTLNNPVSGGTVNSLTPQLSINNSVDHDNDSINYEFELYSDKNLSHKVASYNTFQGDMITFWDVENELTDKTTYYWRAMASDGLLGSSWMPTAVFVINILGADTTTEINAAKGVSASAQSTQSLEVANSDSPLNGVRVEIPAGALENDCTITIGQVLNPPALPQNTKAIGKVIEFGPDGITFSIPVSIMIPYTRSDLDQAGVISPSELEVYTYDTLTLSWEEVSVDRIDEDKMLLVCQADHFSMYTTGKSVTPTQVVDEDRGGYSDSDCFIATSAYGSPMEAHVRVLREFRDRFLNTNQVGKAFVKFYYTYSPPAADFIARHDCVRAIVRYILLPFVGVSWLALHIGSASTIAVLLAFLAMASAIILVSFRKFLKKTGCN